MLDLKVFLSAALNIAGYVSLLGGITGLIIVFIKLGNSQGRQAQVTKDSTEAMHELSETTKKLNDGLHSVVVLLAENNKDTKLALDTSKEAKLIGLENKDRISGHETKIAILELGVARNSKRRKGE